MKKDGANGKLLARLGRNQFFGEVELLRGEQAIACVRAGDDSSVDVLMVGGEDFLRIVKESPITAEALGKIVDARMQEHAKG
jgi:CRP-like cAMP-binding protein